MDGLQVGQDLAGMLVVSERVDRGDAAVLAKSTTSCCAKVRMTAP
jgi:hypothetical protein